MVRSTEIDEETNLPWKKVMKDDDGKGVLDIAVLVHQLGDHHYEVHETFLRPTLPTGCPPGPLHQLLAVFNTFFNCDYYMSQKYQNLRRRMASMQF